MKKFRRQMKTVLSAVSIVVLMIVSAMLLYSSVAASLKACGIITTNEEFSSLETENKNGGQYEMYGMSDAENTEYTLVELAEPSDALSEPAEALPDEEEHDETADLLREGYLSDEIPLSYDLQMTARDAAKRFDVPYALVIAMIWKESSFCETAYNAECYGLMQVASINFEWVCEDLAYLDVDDIADDPADNIYAGTYIISGFVHKYDDYNLALMAYNCGETGASRLWKQGYYSSKYSRSIINYMEDLIEQGIAGEMTLDGSFG